MAVDIAPGVRGAAGPLAAIRSCLASGTAALALPADGWRSSDTIEYTRGAAVIEVYRPARDGFFVTGARTC